jgi:hypothetical protein
MNNGIKYFMAFALWGAAGAVVAWKLLEKKYKRIAEEEIDSYKELQNRKVDLSEVVEEFDEPENLEEQARLAAQAKEKPGIMEYADRIKDAGYTNYATNSDDKEVADVKKAYVISPEEFGELEDYEKVDLVYYADGVLADDMDEVIYDIKDTVGEDSLSRIGEYEDDLIHVRNDELRIDYEITLDTRNYSDVTGAELHLPND